MTKEERIKELEENDFMKYYNFSVVEIEEGKNMSLKGKLTPGSMNMYGIAHGGYIFSLGDTAMGVVVGSTGKNAVTISSTINYLHPAKGKYLIAKAEMIKSGKKTCNLKADIFNDKDELVANMSGVYHYI